MVTKKKQETCTWCQYNGYGCGDKNACDFQSLPYEKDAILQRLKKEKCALGNWKDEFLAGEKRTANEAEVLFGNIVDVAKGMEIMVERLREDFDVTMDEVKEFVGGEKLSFTKKVRLASALAKVAHGGKK